MSYLQEHISYIRKYYNPYIDEKSRYIRYFRVLLKGEVPERGKTLFDVI